MTVQSFGLYYNFILTKASSQLSPWFRNHVHCSNNSYWKTKAWILENIRKKSRILKMSATSTVLSLVTQYLSKPSLWSSWPDCCLNKHLLYLFQEAAKDPKSANFSINRFYFFTSYRINQIWHGEINSFNIFTTQGYLKFLTNWYAD